MIQSYRSRNVTILLIVLLTVIFAIPVFATGNASSVSSLNRSTMQLIANRYSQGLPISGVEKQQLLEYANANPGVIPHPVVPPRTFELDTTGGPDSSGYRFIDSNTPGGPTYSWVDISSNADGSVLASTDDGYAGINFGNFTFPFYGQNYTGTNVGVCSNGWISLGTGTGIGYYNSNLPASSGTNYNQIAVPAICAMWDDWVQFSGGVKYKNMGDGRFVVDWHGYHYSTAGDSMEVEAILYSGGNILFQYRQLVGGTIINSTVGIQGATSGNQWLQYMDSTFIPTANLAVLFYRLGAAANPIPADSSASVPTNTSLSWSAGPAAAAYNVFFGTVNPPVTQVITHQNVLTYTPTLSNNTTYYWNVVSLADTAGNGNTVSGPIWHFTTGSGAAPAAPTNGAISTEPGPSLSSLTFTWTDNANNESGFPITRSTDGNTFTSLTTVSSNEGTGTVSYTDNELTANTHYWYRAYASSESATSTNFASADGWTLAAVPPAATLGVTGITYATISLSDGNNPAGTQYAVYDSTTSNYLQANGTLAATAVWRTSAQWGVTTAMSNLTSGTNYVIKVKARNGAGVETAFSTSLIVATNGAMTLPFNESFANTTPWPPYDWQNVYPSGDFYYWQRSANANGGTTGAAYFNMYYAAVRETAILWTPPISTTGVTSAHVGFDWWFSGYLTGTDTFQVVYSTDGGTTYNVFWERYSGGTGSPQGSDIRTNTSTTNYYQIPSTSSNEWASTEAIIPSGALGQTSVIFGFKAVSGASMYTGSSLGLDNVQIFSVTVPRIGYNVSNVSFGYRVTNGTYQGSAYVKNTGADTLRITNVTASSVTPSWTTHTIVSGDSALLNLSWHPTSAGALLDTVHFTSNANNTALLTVSGMGVDIATLPLSQGFSSNSPWPPDAWQNIYPNGASYYWQYSANGNGGAGAAYDNLYYTTPNQVNILWSPPINTVGSAAVRIDFDWWYSGYLTGADTFQLVYSIDGGNTFTPFWTRYSNGTGGPAGTDIRTNSSTTNYYQIPSSTASEWASTTVMVPDSALNVNGVSFGWRTVKGPTMYNGSSLGLDNILINTAGITTVGGTVLRANQTGVDSALVTLVNTRRLTTTTYTNINGHWSVSVLADTYNISVNKPCMYPDITHQGVVLAIGDSSTRFDSDTVYVPQADASPTSLEFIVQPGGTASQTVVMTNAGDWPTDINASISYPEDSWDKAPKQSNTHAVKHVANALSDYSAHHRARVSIKPVPAPAPVLVHSIFDNGVISTPKFVAPTLPVINDLDTTGGPDSFGYRFIDSAEPNGPVFNWITPSDNATTISGLGDDNHVGPYSIGFTFNFYGVDYTQFYAGSNGRIQFTTNANQDYDYSAWPPTYYTPGVYFWNFDMYARGGTTVQYENLTGPNRLVITYTNLSYYSYASNSTSVQIILYENGRILCQYGPQTGTAYVNGIGILNNATNILTYTHQAPTPNTAVLFHHGSLFNYANVSPDQGQVEQGQPFELSVTATVPDSTPLNTDLSATLVVATNACTTLTVPITIHVLENSVQQASNLPREYKLHQNYPNPFNPTTEIRFDLKAGGMTKLTVYNSLGQVVSRLVDNYLPAGYHSVQFRGSRLATGIYFYRLESGRFTALKKMVMVK